MMKQRVASEEQAHCGGMRRFADKDSLQCLHAGHSRLGEGPSLATEVARLLQDVCRSGEVSCRSGSAT